MTQYSRTPSRAIFVALGLVVAASRRAALADELDDDRGHVDLIVRRPAQADPDRAVATAAVGRRPKVLLREGLVERTARMGSW